jgi:hypothetical protein
MVHPQQLISFSSLSPESANEADSSLHLFFSLTKSLLSIGGLLLALYTDSRFSMQLLHAILH